MTETMIPARDVVAAIRGAFRSADACHCETVGKLGQDELLDRLVRQKVIPPEEIVGRNGLTIADAPAGKRRLRYYLPSSLCNAFTYVAELTNLTRNDLTRYRGVGPMKAVQIERHLAALGFSLKDGDPSLIERVRTESEETAEPHNDRTPTEVRSDAALALINLGSACGRDGHDLVKYGSQLLTRKVNGKSNIRRTVMMLKKYAVNRERTAHLEAFELIEPLIALDDAEREAKSKTPKRHKRHEIRPQDVRNNVVPLRAS
jgi:hypothetical protein